MVSLLCAGMCLGADKIVNEVDDGKTLDRMVVVAVDSSSARLLRERAIAFAREYSKSRRMFRLLMGVKWEDIADAISHGQPHGLSYADTISMIKRRGLPQRPIARLFGIGSNAAFAIRTGLHFSEEIVLGDHDPAELEQSGARFQVLHFSLTRSGPGVSEQPSYALELFARAAGRIQPVQHSTSLERCVL